MMTSFERDNTKSSMWKRRTNTEKCLIWTTLVTVLVGLSLIVALVTVSFKRSTAMCLSPSCIHTSSSVLKYMNPSVSPCEDFYEFACGSFAKQTNIPDDETSVTTFSLIGDQVEEQLRSIVEEPIRATEAKPFRLMKKLYEQCMNTTLVENEGLRTVKSIFREIGGWPVLEGGNWNERGYSWARSIVNLRKSRWGGHHYFVSFYIGLDSKNTTTRVLKVGEPSLGLSREFLTKGLSDQIVKAYYEYMVDIAVLFGAERETAKKELLEVLNFQMKIANLTLPSEKRRNSTVFYNPTTFHELQIKYPYIPWFEYVNITLPPDIKIGGDEKIIVSVPKYLDDFKHLIDATPKRVQANYVLWRTASSSISFLTDEFRKRRLQYSRVVTGRTEEGARWKECTGTAAWSFYLASGALYVRKFFHENARQKAIEMVSNIRAEMEEILENVEWMDDDTKKNALDKAKSITHYIGYPVELLDDQKIIDFYGDLELESSYLRSMLNIWEYGRKRYAKKFREPYNKTDWIDHAIPAVVNAYYSGIGNSIQLPAGILQGVFFDAERPHYMNYGAIGFVIGHEITHGFDDQGRQLDKDGTLVNWWKPETEKAYLEKANCIIHQYGNYTVPEVGLNVNGINTQGENIADNGGIKLAYLAYNKWIQQHGRAEETLPGLNYTPNQMFWISAANTWCNKIRPKTLKLKVITGWHSPNNFRVNGPFSNMEYFARDFNCPVGSKMNPQKKCKVW